MGSRTSGRGDSIPSSVLAALASVSAILLALLAPPSAGAATVVNGDFEAGALSGWQVQNSSYNGSEGSWYEYEGAESSQPPAQGTYAATTDQEGSGTHILYQDVALEPGFTHTLSMTVYYDSHAPLTNPMPNTLNSSGGPSATTFEQSNQQYRIDVIRPSAPIDSLSPSDVLTTVFATKAGDPETLSPTVVTASLTPFAGQTVRIRLAEVDNENPFNAEVDAVSITSAPAPITSPPAMTPTPPPAPAFALGKFEVRRSDGTGKLEVEAPGPGVLTVADLQEAVTHVRSRPQVKAPVALIRRTSTTVASAGTVTVTLRPTTAGKKILLARHRLAFKALVTFAPSSSAVASQTLKGTLRLKAKKPGNHRGR
jgi:carbohydrate binding protein with CBM4/9 domain